MADNTTLSRLEQRLDNQIARVARGQVLTLTISVILILFLVIYMSYMGGQIRNLMTPESVSDIAVGYVEEKLPLAREHVVAHIEANADSYLQQGVNEIQRYIPDARIEAEQFFSDKVAGLITELDGQLNEITDVAIEMHAERIREIVQSLDDDAEAAALEEELYEMFMEPINNSSIRADLVSYAEALSDLSGRVNRLVSRDNLSRIETVESDLLIALRELSNRSN